MYKVERVAFTGPSYTKEGRKGGFITVRLWCETKGVKTEMYGEHDSHEHVMKDLIDKGCDTTFMETMKDWGNGGRIKYNPLPSGNNDNDLA